MKLAKDNGSFLAGRTIPSNATVSNSQVTIDLSQCSAEIGEEVVKFTVKMIFKPSFTGRKNIYMQVKDKTGVWSARDYMGKWMVAESACGLKIDIKPPDAIAYGARWSTDGGQTWHNSGAIVYFAYPQDVTVTFNDVDCYTYKPQDIVVSLTAGQTAEETVWYSN